MNKRIKELAKQANISMIPNSHPISITGLVIDLEKFAELIVKECKKVITEDMDSNPDDEAFNDALDHAQQIIGEHFGVKE